MIADTRLLISLQWQLAWNSFTRRGLARKLLSVAGTVLFCLFVGGFSGGIGYGLGALLRRFPEPALESLTPGLILTAISALLLVVSFGVALGSLFLNSDLELLMSAPVSQRAVFLSKILDGMTTYYLLALVAAGPVLVTYGTALRYEPLYYVLAFVALLGAPLLPAGLASLLVMVLARFVPARRLREVLGLVAMLVGVSGSLLANTWRLWGQDVQRAGGSIGAVLAQLEAIASLPLPSLVAGRGLVAAGNGDVAAGVADLSGFLLLTFGLFALCVVLADRLYAAGWVRLQGAGSASRSRERASREMARSGLLGRAPVPLAIALKDWRMIPRDLRSFARLFTPLVVLPIVYINLLGGGRRGVNALSEANDLAQGKVDFQNVLIAAGILVAAGLIFGRVAGIGISLEGRAWWVLKSAPISGRELLFGKFLAAAVPFAILSTVMMAGAAVWRPFTPLGFLYGWFGVMLLGGGMLAIQSGLAVPWARLEWDDPRRMSSGWGGLLALAICVLLGILGGLLLCLPYIATVLLPAFVAEAWVVGPVAAAAVTAGIAWPVVAFGLSRIASVGE